ncbi:ABC transporter substrate-binding protein [Corynebacterium diphtheriae]|uniref:ABC transporter substrate-binding protein n=2 Tax=Corynebacterium diphtheriae TaxID=1717 RepID=UPI000245A81F|nr:ABC transporter substrate-binding protein [Corynebacterium diphtheriae]AEX41770.1 putative iron transport system exported solute-binding component [Corynebacterium diphtheriae 31A]APM35294.1 iron transporter [Corynebacterium diphtheriae]MBG9296376.1 ABC transporter substrate-binding protein [Corynebacterium diphtheriae bv. gravis]MBG9371389.1 ABC transporter substrate-binding protein [Corynebacterium diphtheriae bv. mitis]OFI52281.1 iron transporter [Corynebacterium diphtheriae]
MKSKLFPLLVPMLGASIVLAGCSNADTSKQAESKDGVTITNCGKEVTYTKADNLFVNDGNIISIALAAGAADNVKYVSSVQRDKELLHAKYGKDIDKAEDVAKEYPSLESIVAKHPDIFVAGWNYGFSEEKNLTPDALKDQGIDSYILSESCRQEGSEKRGLYDPWEAVKMDISNIGKITSHADTADSVVKDIDSRLETLKKAPQADKAPTAFVFDSGTDTVFTSGKFGAPQAIIEAAGGRNGAENVEDTWTTVSWENLAASKPDVFVFVDYPGQEFEEKIAALRSNPATKNLPAVKENRFINLPYAMWTSGPLNIDAAEQMRKGFEKFGLVPSSEIKPSLELPASVPGQNYYK